MADTRAIDILADTLPSGEPRCEGTRATTKDGTITGITVNDGDYYWGINTVAFNPATDELVRCTRAATVRFRVTDDKNREEVFEAKICPECAEYVETLGDLQ